MTLAHVLIAAALAADAAPGALTLDEALRLAGRRNPAVDAARARVSVAEGQLQEARGIEDLRARAEVSVLSPVRGADGASPPVLGGLSLIQPLPTGGEASVTLAQPLAGDPEPSLLQPSPGVAVTLRHPLLRGVGPAFARGPQRIAAAQVEVASVSASAEISEVLRQVAFGYWDLARATAEVRIRRASVEAAAGQLESVRAAVDAGKLPPSASAEVEVALALREDEALAAEHARVSLSAEVARLLGAQIHPDAPALVPTSIPAVPEEPAPFPDLLARAGTASPKLLAARAEREAARIEVELSQNAVLPQLDVYASAATYSSDAAAAFSELGRPGTYALSGGVILEQPIPWRTARGRLSAARHALRMAQSIEANALAELEAQLTRWVDELRSARARAEALDRVVEAARLDLEGERARFESGRATNFDVLRRQEEVSQVELRRADARVVGLKAKAALDALTGELWARFGAGR